MSRWILLDRDGVINADSDAYIKSADEWLPLPGSLEAIAMLKHAGYKIGVATNQSGIARGLYSLDTLSDIHAKMHRLLAEYGTSIDALVFCPHGPDESCLCRKPKPGLLEQIADLHEFSLENVPYIGDSFRDLEAAMAVGATPVLVLTGKGATTLEKNEKNLENIMIFEDLLAAAKHFTQ